MQIANDLRYEGPHVVGQIYLRSAAPYQISGNEWQTSCYRIVDRRREGVTYEPPILPICDTELQKARATARFACGLGNVLLIHP